MTALHSRRVYGGSLSVIVLGATMVVGCGSGAISGTTGSGAGASGSQDGATLGDTLDAGQDAIAELGSDSAPGGSDGTGDTQAADAGGADTGGNDIAGTDTTPPAAGKLGEACGACGDVPEGCVAGLECFGPSETEVDGLCSLDCSADPALCPKGSLCDELNSGLCLPACEDSIECRPGYYCAVLDEAGNAGCIGLFLYPPMGTDDSGDACAEPVAAAKPKVIENLKVSGLFGSAGQLPASRIALAELGGGATLVLGAIQNNEWYGKLTAARVVDPTQDPVPAPLATPKALSAKSEQLGVVAGSSSNTAWLAWVDISDSGASRVRAASVDATGLQLVPAKTDPMADPEEGWYDQISPALACTGSGCVLGWFETGDCDEGTALLVATLGDDGVVTKPWRVVLGPGERIGLSLAALDATTVIAAWAERAGGAPFDPDTTARVAMRLDVVKQQADTPAILADSGVIAAGGSTRLIPFGSAMVVDTFVMGDTSGASSIVAARWDPAKQTWSAPETIDGAEDCASKVSPVLAGDAGGLVAMWIDARYGFEDARPFLAASTDGGATWGAGGPVTKTGGYFESYLGWDAPAALKVGDVVWLAWHNTVPGDPEDGPSALHLGRVALKDLANWP